MNIISKAVFAWLVVLPLTASALNWPSKTTAELKSDCVRFARESGLVEFADRIASESNTTNWIGETIRFCENRFKLSEGKGHADPERRRTLRLLDYPLHVDNYAPTTTKDEIAAYQDAVIAYLRRSIARVLREAKAAKVSPGSLQVWHLYNMAYVVKGAHKTVLIDFTPHPSFGRNTPWTEADWQAFAELGDLLVITHPHGDHTSFPLMRRMRALGKTLVLPCPMRDRATGESYSAGDKVVVLDRDHAESVSIDGVKLWNFMGYQGVPCNTYLMEIDGVRVVDNGDNSRKECEWNLVKCPPADIIISSTWSHVTNIVSACKTTPGFKMKRAVFLPSHENELMHTVDHRESYREMYEDKRRLASPGFEWPRVEPLAWGESMTFPPASERPNSIP